MRTWIVALALACALAAVAAAGVSAAPSAALAPAHHAAKAKPKPKKGTKKKAHPAKKHVVKKKTPPKAAPTVAARYDCGKLISASLFNSLAGGFGGTYGPRDHDLQVFGDGGSSRCGYTQSAGYPRSSSADAPASVLIIYGAHNATSYHTKDYAAAAHNFGASCAAMKAKGNPVPTDPRQCGPVPIPALGAEAYEAGSYIDVLRGSVLVTVSIAPLPPGPGEYTMQYPSQDLLSSIAAAVLAKIK